ncbi:MAG: IclR family transcriptional regulator [Candidatus Hydrogenedentes bacterium]|nr:IclR family transcriptional regulator [Candidatus Hydrogenedentota bacterium]
MRNATLQKGLLLLETMAAEAREFTLAELAQLTGLDKGHACRLLKTFVANGYVNRHPRTRRYWIGLRTLELSHSILSRMELRRVGMAYIRDLSDRLGAATYLGVLHLGRVLTVATVYPAGCYTDGAPGFGSVMELTQSAMGKVLLAHMPPEQRAELLPEQGARSQEWAEELDEIARSGVGVILKPSGPAPTVIGVAAPIRTSEGRVVAAIGASDQKASWDGRDQEQFRTAVRNAGQGLSFALGHAASRVTLAAPAG